LTAFLPEAGFMASAKNGVKMGWLKWGQTPLNRFAEIDKAT
jgi:hypothetical protein